MHIARCTLTVTHAACTLAVRAVHDRAGTGWNAFHRAFDNAAFALHGLGHAALGRVSAGLRRLLLDIARLALGRLDRLGRFVGRLFRRHRFSDVNRATCEQCGARGSRGQFRQGQFYRHGQTLLLLPVRAGKRRLRPHEHVPVTPTSDQVLKPAMALTMIWQAICKKYGLYRCRPIHLSRYGTEVAAFPNEVAIRQGRKACSDCRSEAAFPSDSSPIR